MRECVVDGHVIRSTSSLHNESRAFVRLGSRVGEHFEVMRGLRRGCVMSPWLFNIFLEQNGKTGE